MQLEPLDIQSSFNPDGLGSYLVLKFKNLQPEAEDWNTSCTAFRLNVDSNSPEIEMLNFVSTCMSQKVKVKTLNDNIVLMSPEEIIIYNLGKQKDLKITNPHSEVAEQLIDVYIDQKSRIYVASSHRVMLVSLKKQKFETVYQSETHCIQKFIAITADFWIFRNSYGDIVFLDCKSSGEFVEKNVTQCSDFGMGQLEINDVDSLSGSLKIIIPEYNIKVYDFSSSEDMIFKKRENRQTKIPYKIINYLPYNDTYWIFYTSREEANELLIYNIKLNHMASYLPLPAQFHLSSSGSMWVSNCKNYIFLLSSIRGVQDLAPEEEGAHSTLPYEQNFMSIVQVNQFKVTMEGKPQRYMDMNLLKTQKLAHKVCHMQCLRDQYFVCATDEEVLIFEFLDDGLEFKKLDGLSQRLDGGEKERLSKDMTTKLVKDEILALDAFGVLNQEVVRNIKWCSDSSSDEQKIYNLFITTNFKLYLLRIEFLNNEFYFIQMAEEGKNLQLLSITFLSSLKIEQECDSRQIRVIDINSDRVVCHIQKNEIWQVDNKSSKNNKYLLDKQVLWKRPLHHKGKFIDLYNENHNAFEWKLMLEGEKDFTTIKLNTKNS